MKKCFLLFSLLFFYGFGLAQTKDSLSVEEQERRKLNIEAGNPFKEFGYTPKIATLSKGKYLEWHDLDSIVRIGSYSYHVKKKEITGYNMHEDKNSESTLRPELTSRWMSPDPLAEEFPSWTPYHYVHNNPINLIDPTGMAAEDWYADSGGNIVYDENIQSQEDLDKAGIDGNYIAESFLGADQNGQVYNFQSDGNVTYTPGATTSAYIAGGIPENAFVAIESTPLGTKSGDSMAAAGATVATPSSSNPLGAIVNATAGLALLITAAVQISGDNDMQYSFSKAKDAGKNDRHGDGGRAQTKSERQIADLETQLKGASGNSAKKIKQKIKNIRETSASKKKGETHTRNAKGN